MKDSNAEEFNDRTRKVHWPFFGLGTYKPSKHGFKGHVYVLIDGGSSSAVGDFTDVLKKYGNVTLIGNETGGSGTLVGDT